MVAVNQNNSNKAMGQDWFYGGLLLYREIGPNLS